MKRHEFYLFEQCTYIFFCHYQKSGTFSHSAKMILIWALEECYIMYVILYRFQNYSGPVTRGVSRDLQEMYCLRAYKALWPSTLSIRSEEFISTLSLISYTNSYKFYCLFVSLSLPYDVEQSWSLVSLSVTKNCGLLLFCFVLFYPFLC